MMGNQPSLIACICMSDLILRNQLSTLVLMVKTVPPCVVVLIDGVNLIQIKSFRGIGRLRKY